MDGGTERVDDAAAASLTVRYSVKYNMNPSHSPVHVSGSVLVLQNLHFVFEPNNDKTNLLTF